MKLGIILILACAFLLTNPNFATSDETSDLKKEIKLLQNTINELKGRVDELEEKQETQAEEIEKIPDIAETLEEIEEQPSTAQVIADELGKNVNVGGHFKFYLLDRADGERNGSEQNNNLSAGIHDLYLYFSKSLTDWLSIDVAPQVEVFAAATPRLGGDISRSTSASVDLDLDEAYMTARLPKMIELRAGAFYPLFSEEYARQAWWHEQYNGNNGLVHLQAWQDTGLEIYKNFDFEKFSLPVYVYPYLNGARDGSDDDARFVDNNGAKSVLVHVSPEVYFSGSRVKLLGSLGYGRWDDNDDHGSRQYLLGFDLNYKSFNLLSEYLSRERDNVPLLGGSAADWKNKGYYVRGMYTFNSKWRALVKYSDVDQPFVSTTMLKDTYQAWSFAVNYWITQGSTIIPQIEYVDAERSDGSELLEYLRYTIGWRTTF